jgi:hypothetical protein
MYSIIDQNKNSHGFNDPEELCNLQVRPQASDMGIQVFENVGTMWPKIYLNRAELWKSFLYVFICYRDARIVFTIRIVCVEGYWGVTEVDEDLRVQVKDRKRERRDRKAR